MRVACFVSPHGLGHAARAAAVLAALHARRPALVTDIYTLVAESFFEDSRSGPCHYHSLRTDLGMVQKTQFEEDAAATASELARLLPFDTGSVQALAATLRANGCRAVLCDIAPLGIAVARAAGLPSVLIENFTWDWIYATYTADEPRLVPFAAQMRALFDVATHHVQAAPACSPNAKAVQVGVISRRPRTPRDRVRQQLNLAPRTRMVLITNNLLDADGPGAHQLRAYPDCTFVLAGGTAAMRRVGNLVMLPAVSAFYHPDLVHAADVVVGKLGYSTLAECYQAGVIFAYLTRPRFPESPIMETFARSHMHGARICPADLANGRWLDMLPAWLARPRLARPTPNGADVLADWLLAHVLQG
ncbi:MAG: hypothetical protein O3B24_08155 [Verrucomicrobia bacterium]|nr:hypothetical protein [Verrucomicrobiota bacterium]